MVSKLIIFFLVCLLDIVNVIDKQVMEVDIWVFKCNIALWFWLLLGSGGLLWLSVGPSNALETIWY